jgi:subtilisin family serine protease
MKEDVYFDTPTIRQMFRNESSFSGFVFAGAAFAALSLASCAKEVDVNSASTEMISSDARVNGNSENEFVPNQLLVKFKKGVSKASRDKALARANAAVAEKILTKAMARFNDEEGILLVNTPLAVLEAKSKITGEEIEFAEPNYIYQHNAGSNDTYYVNGSLWGVLGDGISPFNQYGSQANEAWAGNNTGLASVHIGVIDEGAMFSHTDLAGQIWTNPFDAPDGVDNDGNGYVDDVHGWDFDGNNNTTFDGTEDDHGTHVSGTIGAKGANNLGIAGVSWNVTIITAKFLGRRGGTTANAIKAVDYITDLKIRHRLTLPATNNSWGGGGFSQALKDAIDRANNANILFVAAAGNGGRDGVGDNNDATPHYPANYTSANVISVASITSSGAKSSFSNYGATSVDIGAPGSSIISTVPGKGGTSGYASYSGTSMATPHVTGGIALYAAKNPTASAGVIKTAITSNAVPTASLTGRCTTGGRLNVGGFK